MSDFYGDFYDSKKEILIELKELWGKDHGHFPRQKIEIFLGEAYRTGRKNTLAEVGSALIEGRIFGRVDPKPETK